LLPGIRAEPARFYGQNRLPCATSADFGRTSLHGGTPRPPGRAATAAAILRGPRGSIPIERLDDPYASHPFEGRQGRGVERHHDAADVEAEDAEDPSDDVPFASGCSLSHASL
jgi:hypothetical protein